MKSEAGLQGEVAVKMERDAPLHTQLNIPRLSLSPICVPAYFFQEVLHLPVLPQ